MRRCGTGGSDGGMAGDGDCCRPAVTRAYREMRASGAPEPYCLDAALAVYRWYHPESTEPDAAGIVSYWIADGRRH
ncbi:MULTISPECIES: hypothetical protein [unclassified Azospirillum]|uniref:hypothetical protein n=1 Tax=unclassified Azospirillum TaxID=2630922 RepID=UPI000B6CBC3E|nr:MULTISPECIES: hypothetical protein [unclassified Azospirillum]SNT15177.1 hypothetical protein SAMN05880556_12715 [Azospirillum sp. RU38E]SNT28206.1 hypothetical protein SAMN05880591_12715 [Azospirillum sp. RU37A]